MRKCQKYARNAQRSCSTGSEYAVNASVRSRWRSNESAAQDQQQKHASEWQCLELQILTQILTLWGTALRNGFYATADLGSMRVYVYGYPLSITPTPHIFGVLISGHLCVG